MRLQFITYHRTTVLPDRKDVHTVTFDQFARHVELIRRSGITVASPQVLEDGGAAENYQLGIAFDDGYKSDLANAELLARHGMAAIFFISTAHIGHEGYLDEGDICHLRDLGMGIGSHSHRHTRLNKLSEAEAHEQLVRSKDYLERILKQPVDCLAFPGGAYNDSVVAQAQEVGFRHLMTTEWGINTISTNAGGLYRRNNILASMSDEVFVDLITLKSLQRRRLEYLAKQWIRALLPERGYVALRKFVLRGNRDA